MTIFQKALAKDFTTVSEDTHFVHVSGRGSLTISGDATGFGIQLMRSVDGVADPQPVLLADLTAATFAANGSIAIHDGDGDGGYYRCKCTAIGGGTASTLIKDDNAQQEGS